MSIVLASQDDPMDPERRETRSQKKRKATGPLRETNASNLMQGTGTDVLIPSRPIPTSYDNRFTVKLKYADTMWLQHSHTATANQRFALNDIWDPDVTGIGHQPYQRDNWAALYALYNVLETHVKLTFYNMNDVGFTSTTTPVGVRLPSIISISPYTNTTALSSAPLFPRLEMKNESHFMLAPEASYIYEHTFNNDDFQMSGIDADNDRTWTSVGSSPSLRKGIDILTMSGYPPAIAGVSPAGAAHHNICMLVELEYTVQFIDYTNALRTSSS